MIKPMSYTARVGASVMTVLMSSTTLTVPVTTAAVVGATLTLSACQNPAQTEQTAAQIAAAIAAGVQALVPALTALGLSPEASAQVSKYAAVVAQIAAQIEANPGSTTASQLQQIEDAVNQIIAAASTISSLPPTVQTILGALAVALPMLEAAVGILLNNLPTPAPTASARAAFHATFPTLSGGQILGILNGAASSLR